MVVKSEPPEITPPSPSSSVPPPARSTGRSATLSPSTATSRNATRIRMAPMSPTYDRLEAGRPPIKQAKRFGWKRFAIGASLLLALVWLFVPKEKRSLGWGGSPEFEKGNTPYEGKPSTPDDGELNSGTSFWSLRLLAFVGGFEFWVGRLPVDPHFPRCLGRSAS
ncbi:hypothetical protein DFH06DRAFT_332996 [Mycena polygramma]|nr:hypothetical protein DFH06DRAFT_332996 [Mycena polygramma]